MEPLDKLSRKFPACRGQGECRDVAGGCVSLKKTSKGPRRLTASSVSGYSRACKAFQSHVEIRLDFGSPNLRQFGPNRIFSSYLPDSSTCHSHPWPSTSKACLSSSAPQARRSSFLPAMARTRIAESKVVLSTQHT